MIGTSYPVDVRVAYQIEHSVTRGVQPPPDISDIVLSDDVWVSSAVISREVYVGWNCGHAARW
jgi:hypothetical protein